MHPRSPADRPVLVHSRAGRARVHRGHCRDRRGPAPLRGSHHERSREPAGRWGGGRGARRRRRPGARQRLRRLRRAGAGALPSLRRAAAPARAGGLADADPGRPGHPLRRRGVRRPAQGPGQRAQGARRLRARRAAGPGALRRGATTWSPLCLRWQGAQGRRAGGPRAGAVAAGRRAPARSRPAAPGGPRGGRRLRRRGHEPRCAGCWSPPAGCEDQSTLGRVERAANLAGSMRCPGGTCRRVPGPEALVVVVDDVLTTGRPRARRSGPWRRRRPGRGRRRGGGDACDASVARRDRWVPYRSQVRATNVGAWSPSGSVVASPECCAGGPGPRPTSDRQAPWRQADASRRRNGPRKTLRTAARRRSGRRRRSVDHGAA